MRTGEFVNHLKFWLLPVTSQQRQGIARLLMKNERSWHAIRYRLYMKHRSPSLTLISDDEPAPVGARNRDVIPVRYAWYFTWPRTEQGFWKDAP